MLDRTVDVGGVNNDAAVAVAATLQKCSVVHFMTRLEAQASNTHLSKVPRTSILPAERPRDDRDSEVARPSVVNWGAACGVVVVELSAAGVVSGSGPSVLTDSVAVSSLPLLPSILAGRMNDDKRFRERDRSSVETFERLPDPGVEDR